MLEHLSDPPQPPRRVVVMGAKGFVGAAITHHLERANVSTLALGRPDVDLLQAGADDRVADALHADDALVFVSSLAPCKDADMLFANLAMTRAVCRALGKKPVAHVVVISSDAVYPASAETVSEQSAVSPADFHGTMHQVRELLIRTATKAPTAILRPSLLYGAADPHNGYGPNRFRRLASDGKDITLFGNGEEKRDHVFIDDVAAIVGLCLSHRSRGILNVATGRSASFREVAEMIVAGSRSSSRILPTARQNPVLHRHFDTADRIKAFPEFAFTPLETGFAQVLEQTAERAA